MPSGEFFKSSAPILKTAPGQLPFGRDALAITPGKGGALILYFNSATANDPGWYFLVYATAPLSPGVSHPKISAFKHILSIESGTFGSILIFTLQYQSRFRIIESSDVFFVQVKYVNPASGQVQDWGYYKTNLEI